PPPPPRPPPPPPPPPPPAVFLFDEPLSNLDAKLRVQMRTEIKLLHQRLKTTSIYVTHDQVEAMTMADQIVVMRDGRVEQAGAPLHLYDNPANVFVAGFIGSPAMNFIDGTVADGGVRAGDGTLLPLPAGAKVEAGKRVRYGVRPSHLRVAADGAGLPTEVEVMEPTGDDTFVYGRMAGQEICAMFNQRQSFGPGDTIRLQPDVGRVHLFDAETERRL
ncbi:ABC transporter ATP-binding protein, partial [Inquilinus sp. OTU3971]|uniref:ABC transporter ATP-binding protein n=1 Tax=Inquilinus sp. OTU3971 TaxID=3043855 RepID=UPI00313F1B3B